MSEPAEAVPLINGNVPVYQRPNASPQAGSCGDRPIPVIAAPANL